MHTCTHAHTTHHTHASTYTTRLCLSVRKRHWIRQATTNVVSREIDLWTGLLQSFLKIVITLYFVSSVSEVTLKMLCCKPSGWEFESIFTRSLWIEGANVTQCYVSSNWNLKYHIICILIFDIIEMCSVSSTGYNGCDVTPTSGQGHLISIDNAKHKEISPSGPSQRWSGQSWKKVGSKPKKRSSD